MDASTGMKQSALLGDYAEEYVEALRDCHVRFSSDKKGFYILGAQRRAYDRILARIEEPEKIKAVRK